MNSTTGIEQLGLEMPSTNAQPTKENEFLCPECERRCTRDPSNGLEYGHDRRDRCSRRPPEVDPGDIRDYDV